MNTKKLIVVIMIVSTLFSCNNESKFNYPITEKQSISDNYFGTQVQDPYRWLEDDNSNETKNWVKLQNEVTFAYLNSIPFKQNIIDRLTEIVNYERYTAPSKKSGKYFFFKNNGLQNQSVLYIQDSLTAEPKILLDPNTLSKEGTVALTNVEVSKDAKHLAYAIAKGGSDWNEIFVRNIETGKDTEDKIEWVKFSNITWYKDGFFYSRYPETKSDDMLTNANKFQKVYYHKLGTKQENDELIYENNQNGNRMYTVSISGDEKFLFMYETETTSGNALYFRNMEEKDSKFIKIAEGFEYEYEVLDNIDGKLYIKTNDEAPKYKLIAIDTENIARENWQTIIPEENNVLDKVRLGANKIVVSYMEDAKSKLLIFDIQGNREGELPLPGIGTCSEFSSKKNQNEAFYTFTSFTIPSIIYKYDFETKKSEIFRQPQIKGLDFSEYITEQVKYKSKDGTEVPMFITRKKSVKLDGNAPTILYGYGGFNISLTPSYKSTGMVWLENGGIYAVANIRGGGEYGEKWHKAGTKLNKQNVFDDFIAAAEYLIQNKYTSNKKLAIQGGSNGGLLIGAVTNQRPDLFKVSLAHVGVMDMLRYQYFTIGRAWSGDYGLSEDSTMFKYLHKYSPVHNISDKNEYPAVLVLTADHDDRVVPAHSFKYIATLQEKYKGTNPVMIRIETQAGHGAGKPISKVIEEQADIYSFVYKNMGINPYQK